MARPKRLTQQIDLKEVIKVTALNQIAAFGAPTLSLRAIARELKITAPAIYNYFPRRDDLVTALIIDAYTSFGDSQLLARDSVPVDDLNGRLNAVGWAYRSWALTFPQRYQLIFGTPIPGYACPAELVMPSSIRSLVALVSVLEDLRLAGRLNGTNFPSISPGFEPAFEARKKVGGEVHSLSLSMAILFWSQVHGLVSLEINGNLPPFGPGGDALYAYELDLLTRNFINDR